MKFLTTTTAAAAAASLLLADPASAKSFPLPAVRIANAHISSSISSSSSNPSSAINPNASSSVHAAVNKHARASHAKAKGSHARAVAAARKLIAAKMATARDAMRKGKAARRTRGEEVDSDDDEDTFDGASDECLAAVEAASAAFESETCPLFGDEKDDENESDEEDESNEEDGSTADAGEDDVRFRQGGSGSGPPPQDGSGSRPQGSGSGPRPDGSGSGSGPRPDGSGSGSGPRPNGSGSGSGPRPDGSGSGSGPRPDGSGSGSGPRPDGSGSGSGPRPDGSGSGSGPRPDGSGSGSGPRPDGSGSGRDGGSGSGPRPDGSGSGSGPRPDGGSGSGPRPDHDGSGSGSDRPPRNDEEGIADLRAFCDSDCFQPAVDVIAACGDEIPEIREIKALTNICSSEPREDGRGGDDRAPIECLESLEGLTATCDFDNTLDLETVDADAAAAFCENDCQGQVRSDLRCLEETFEEAGEANPADELDDPEVALAMDMICMRDADGELCSETLESLTQNDMDLDTCAATQEDLESVCNPCFKKLVARMQGFIEANGDEDDAAEFDRDAGLVQDILCLREDDEFCLLNNELGFCDEDEDSGDEGDDVTQAELEQFCGNRCNTKILIKVASSTDDEEEKAQIKSQIDIGCSKQEDGNYCLALLSDLDNSAGLDSCPEFFDDMDSAIDCSNAECAAAVQKMGEDLGCCVSTLYDQWKAEAGEEAGAAFIARFEAVGAACEATFSTSACNAKRGTKKVRGELVIKADENACADAETEAALLEAAKTDIAATIGTSEENIINMECVVEEPASRKRDTLIDLSIEFDIQAEDDETTTELGASFAKAVEADELEVTELTKTYNENYSSGSFTVDTIATQTSDVNSELGGDTDVDSASSALLSALAGVAAVAALLL